MRLRGKDDRRITIGARAASKLLVQVARAILLLLVVSSAARAQAARPFEITDNSFLVEEAFNQEAGIFQNIATFRMNARDELGHELHAGVAAVQPSASDLLHDPLRGSDRRSGRRRRNDPLSHPAADRGRRNAGVLAAHLPDRAERQRDRGLGNGSAGWQVNLPFSEQAGDTYLHWNVGGDPAVDGLFTPHAGASAIWRARPMVNVMLETMIQRKNGFTVSPGARSGGIAATRRWL